MSHSALAICSSLPASFRPRGGSGSFRLASMRPMSRRSPTDSLPMPRATRSGVPNRLVKHGML